MNKFIDVQEAGWYQQFQLDTSFKVYFLPAKHWYLRAPWDRNKILWGSFLIEYKNKKFYFSGDSAYDTHFKTIGQLFGDIDYCFMPIGAYKPSYIMQSNHMNPEEAVRAYIDLKGKHFIPMPEVGQTVQI
jgi:L-ascorbate metabolism protein UlaG (beta-lactamase superfamily)